MPVDNPDRRGGDEPKGKKNHHDCENAGRQLRAEQIGGETSEQSPKRGGDGKNKRGYNVTHDSQVTAEDMEAYRMKKRAFEDPMNKASGAGTDGYDLV